MRALLPPESAAETLATVHARTAGNPFYVVELGRLLAPPASPGVPARVREIVRARVERARSATRELLEAGAVAGRFTIADLVRVPAAYRARGGRGGRARRVGGRDRR